MFEEMIKKVVELRRLQSKRLALVALDPLKDWKPL